MPLPGSDDFPVVAGRLCINPTNLALGFPHGGTDLGLARDVAVVSGQAYAHVRAQEFGVEVVEAVDLGAAVVLAVSFRSIVPAVLSTLFPGIATGGSSGKKVIEWPPQPATTTDTWRAGRLLSGRSVVLLFTPDEPTRWPCQLLYRALPERAEGEETELGQRRELRLKARFVGIRDGSNRMWKQGRLADLSL